MRTDELADEFDVDRALRDLLPAMPRSQSWESAKRDELLAYISPGTSQSPASTKISTSEVEVAVRLDVIAARRPRAMRRAVVGIAAAVVLIAGLVPRWLSTEPTIEGPDDSGVSVESTVALVADLPATPLRPDRFPTLPSDDPRAAASTANYGGQLGWDNPASAEALVARINGNTMTGGIQLQALARFDSSTYPLPTSPINVAGTDMTIFTAGGTPALKTVVLPGSPALAVTGLDPVAFLESAGGIPILGARTGADGEVSFAVGSLPDGYEVVVPPSRLPRGSWSAMTSAPDGDGGDGISAWVDVHNPLPAYAMVGDLNRVDINGVSGWMRDEGRGSPVIWQVSPTTWAYTGGATTADDAVAFARSLKFVDEAIWRTQFNLTEPNFQTKEQALQPPPSTLPEPTALIVGHRTIDVDTPEITPAGYECGNLPYTDNTVADPITAPDPTQALATFLTTPRAQFLFKLGYDEISIVNAGTYRYERRNNIGALVTVIFVEPVDGGWAATRWQASPC